MYNLKIKSVADVCRNRTACPYLEFRSCEEVLDEINRLRAETRDLRGVFETATTAFKEKEQETNALREENKVLRAKFRDLAQRPFARNTTTEDDTQEENVPPEPKTSRKKRGAPKGHRGATRKKPERPPDRTVFVQPEECPKCNSRNISPCKDTESHDQEDIVIVRPILTRFVKRRGYCKNCGKTFFPSGKDEIPKGYIGPRALATASYLRYAIKMPFESARNILDELWGMPITSPALAGFDKKLADTGRPLYKKLADIVRFSTSVNTDETSWPRGSSMDWLWTFANTDCVLFKIAPSRAGKVASDILGENYGGVLGSDCFRAYNALSAKAKQKCLTHYERAASNLEKFYPNDETVCRFSLCLKDIFQRARQTKRDWITGSIDDEEANQAAGEFEEELDQLTETTLDNRDAENLRKRLVTHRAENFTFLRYKEVEPDNNRAERALRPSVVMRKITYGNNSEIGARNHETLMSLIETAKLRRPPHDRNLLALMTSLAKRETTAEIEKSLFDAWDTS